MTDEKLLKKLRIKPGMRLLILNAPRSFLDAIQPLPAGIELDATPSGAKYDYGHVFSHNSGELARYGPAVLSAVKPEALLWFSYPKKSSGLETDLNRDSGWKLVIEAGYRPVAQVAIDDTWSALRFRPRGDESPGALVEAQFAGPKASLRPLYERLVAEARKLDPSIKLAPRESYVALQKNKTFALIKASTRDRLDLGLKLPTYEAAGRLQESAGFGSGSITHKVALHSLDDIDEDVLAWLQAAYKTVT